MHESSKLRVLENCPGCGRTVFSIYDVGRIAFDIDSWDGSDYFIVWPFPGYKSISSDFKSIIEDQEGTGVKFMEFEEWKPGLVGTLAPGLVSSWIEGARGKKLQASIDSEVARRFQ